MTRRPTFRLSNSRFSQTSFIGGLDTETPPWDVKPGFIKDSLNWEVGINGGYETIVGYERFDGRPKPSDALYAILDVIITGAFSLGGTITGDTSGATAVVIAISTPLPQAYLAITKIVGTFDPSEDLLYLAVVQGMTVDVPVIDGAATSKLDATYRNLAADNYRADIAVVPGEGDVLGVKRLQDVIYSWRNAVGGASAKMYKSTAAGWVEVALGRELPYTSGGTYIVSEGDTITGAIGGATAVITRVVQETGDWSTSDSTGRVIFASQTGTFQAENLDVGGNLDVATIAADSTAIPMLPDGKYEVRNGTFGNNKRLYGVDRVNRGFETDGTVFVPIDTGVPADTPNHVNIHKSHLFYAFGQEVQHSGINFPYVFDPLVGADAIATKDEITGFQGEPGNDGTATLGIYNRNQTHMLYGTSAANWDLNTYRDELGAFAYTIQQFNRTTFLDDRGVTDLVTAQEFGNFNHATISRNIQRWINLRKTLASASCLARDKNQYRLFFSNGEGLYITRDGPDIIGMMPVGFPDEVLCMTSEENVAGEEEIFFGSDNGFVYQLDKGTSFDGENIETSLQLHFDFIKNSIGWEKGFYNNRLDVTGFGYVEFTFEYELGNTDPDIPQGGVETVTLDFQENRWDVGTWDVGNWDSASIQSVNVDVSGDAENISQIFKTNSDEMRPVRISGSLMRYLMRKPIR